MKLLGGKDAMSDCVLVEDRNIDRLILYGLEIGCVVVQQLVENREAHNSGDLVVRKKNMMSENREEEH
ncbi:hypothetical protein L3Y34_011510 [Caenorhabditis briggsae]|uniref:Uncharacterized protein n=1 Tax=Caenorhabditis briggsae TaxID=6238 RepID=A0AAE8ZRG1_CAEBR|nr:hypothetical protein L3Y34_011510 [Caenorhabditis briggsae]